MGRWVRVLAGLWVLEAGSGLGYSAVILMSKATKDDGKCRFNPNA